MKKIIICFPIFYLSSMCASNQQTIENFVGLFCKSNGLVFDIGANVGKNTDIYLKHGAKVVCVEPQPFCIKKLKEKYIKNKNVVIIGKAIAEKCGNMKMNICSAAPTISTLSDKWVKDGRFAKHDYKWDKTISVEVTTLDELIKKFGVPNFCKIDVENFEVQVLRGLSVSIPLLSFEFAIEFSDDAKKCISLLCNLGYKKFNVGFGEEPIFISDEWQSGEQIIKTILEYSILYPNGWGGWGAWGDIYAWNGNYPKK